MRQKFTHEKGRGSYVDERFFNSVEKYAWDNCLKLKFIIGDQDYLMFQNVETKQPLMALSNKETANNHPVVNTFDVCKTMSNLPEDSLKELAYTEDLRQEWQIQRYRSRIISYTFLMAHLDLNFDLIERERSTLHYLVIKFYERLGYQYSILWELTKLVFDSIKQINNNFPFCTPKNLFIHMIASQRNSNFEKLLWNDNVEHLSQDLEKSFFCDEWLMLVLGTAEVMQKKSRLIKLAKHDYIQCCEDINEVIDRLKNARGSQGKIIKSEIWQSGMRITTF